MNKELIKKLELLRRNEEPKASVCEAIDTLINCCEFLLNNQPERSNRKVGDNRGQDMDEIEKIIPTKTPKGLAISLGKGLATFKREQCGINEELLGPYQLERSKREDRESGCGALNITET